MTCFSSFWGFEGISKKREQSNQWIMEITDKVGRFFLIQEVAETTGIKLDELKHDPSI